MPRLECQGCGREPCACFSAAQRDAHNRERIADALEALVGMFAGLEAFAEAHVARGETEPPADESPTGR